METQDIAAEHELSISQSVVDMFLGILGGFLLGTVTCFASWWGFWFLTPATTGGMLTIYLGLALGTGPVVGCVVWFVAATAYWWWALPLE